MNTLDKFINFFNPKAGAKREYYRAVGNTIERKFDGASKGKRLNYWNPGSDTLREYAHTGGQTLRNRARDLVNNNPYAEKAVSAISSNTIGSGIVPQAKKNTKRIEKLWKEWAETPACDYEGQSNFYGIQDIVMGTVAEVGEILIRRVRARSSEGLPLPLQIQLLEPEFLDTSKDGHTKNGNVIKGGIEFNKKQKRVAYHLYTQHPDERFFLRKSYESTRVPAEDIKHIYHKKRPGQIRGVSWFAPVIVRLRDFDEYEDAQLLKQKFSACYSALIRDNLGEDGLPTPSEKNPDELTAGDRVRPGTYEVLPPGKDIVFPTMPSVAEYGEYSDKVLHAIASGLKIPYEVLTGDFSRVNFSSGRMGWLEFHRNIDKWRKHIIITQFCNPAWDWFMEAAVLQGRVQAETGATWTAPRREMIDPAKETKARKDEVRSGLKPLSTAIRENGGDPEEVFAQMQKDNETLDALGLVLDTDPRNDMERTIQDEQASE